MITESAHHELDGMPVQEAKRWLLLNVWKALYGDLARLGHELEQTVSSVPESHTHDQLQIQVQHLNSMLLAIDQLNPNILPVHDHPNGIPPA